MSRAEHAPDVAVDASDHEGGSTTLSGGGARRAVRTGGPLALLVVVVIAILAVDPVDHLAGDVLPAEELAIESVTLTPDRVEARVRNVGSTAVSISQVQINEAYWNHTVGDRDLERLESTTVTAAYPWEEGLPLHISLLTSAGTRVDHEIPIAVAAASRDWSTMLGYASLGALIGIVPVAIGLLWFSALRGTTRRWRTWATAFTGGLLALLLVDTLEEALEAAEATGAALNGIGLVAVGSILMVAAITYVEDRIPRRWPTNATTGIVPAYVLALAIGMHNFGEGLAVTTSIATGEVALGATLLLGFVVHNSTEGFAIALPATASERLGALHFVGLSFVAGVPAIVGAVVGNWALTPGLVALAFGAAAGALVQVLWVLARGMVERATADRRMVATGFGVGVAVMYVTGLLTA